MPSRKATQTEGLRIFKIKKSGEITSVYAPENSKEPSPDEPGPEPPDSETLKMSDQNQKTAQSKPREIEKYHHYLKKISRQVEQLKRKNEMLLQEIGTLKQREEDLKSQVKESKPKHSFFGFSREQDHACSEGEPCLEKPMEVLAKEEKLWEEKVSEDLKRSKLKEREFENKMELLRRDSQTLLDSKDKHILELKQFVDALEQEKETLEDRLRAQQRHLDSIDAKKKRLVETMRLAITLLEELDSQSESS